MLASPHYAERWARHWLDVARYGESDGFEYDRLRPNAWRYRDWVIQALHADMPYDEFARQQIAGDVLYPDDADAATATGFLVCGAFDGLLPQGDVMKQIMRQDVLEDFVGTVGQTFLGLTVNCARCHDHKFDPISHVEYYQLTAALNGVTHGERTVRPKPKRLAMLLSEIAETRRLLAELEGPALQAIAAARALEKPTNRGPAVDVGRSMPIAEWDFQKRRRTALIFPYQILIFSRNIATT